MMSPQPKTLRERKKQDKLARIEQAARRLFSENGYDKTTTRAIAQEAGIGAGTLFVYFPEKRDLLFHLFSMDVRSVKKAAFANLPEGTLIDQLMSVFEAYFDYYARDPGLARVFVKEMGFVSDRDRSAHNSLALELITGLAGLIAEAQERGEVERSVTSLAAAYQIFGMYFAALIGWLGGSIPVRENQLAMLRSGLVMLYRGLAPRTEER
jgi:AcrR family transcriptional regulator